MTIEAHDEILAPQRCARCGAVFSPPPDNLVFCPACNACHVGLPLPPGINSKELPKAWLLSFTGDATVHSGGGYVMRRSQGRLFIVGHGVASREPSGFATLVELGEADMTTGPRYTVLRVAGFSPAGAATAGQVTPTPYGPVSHRPWGLELVAFDAARVAIDQAGRDVVLANLAQLARQSGYEPVLESSNADVAELPPEVSASLGAGRTRAVRCDACGAPVEPTDLGASPRCPYCLAPVQVPPALAGEIERYRMQLQAQDAQFSLQGASLWDGLAAATGAWLACAVCGSPRAHQPGVVDEACQHCGAMIVPSTQRLLGDVASARAELAALSLRRQAAARAQMEAGLRTASTAVRLNVALFVVSSLFTLGMGLGPLLFGSGSTGPLAIALTLFMVGSLPLAGLLFGIYFVRRNARQRRVWGPLWAAIAEQLDGKVSPSSSAWLASRWTASGPTPSWMGSSPARGAVEAVCDGVSVLIDADLESRVGPFRSQWASQEHLRIYIAAQWPETTGILKATRGIRDRRRELVAAGFESCVRRCGLELKASREVVQRLRKHPEQTAAVVPVLFEALRIVKLLGA